MRVYVDSGFLCSLYAQDVHSRRAAAKMAQLPIPVPVTWLHQLEVRNALRLRVFRTEITAVQRAASLNDFLSDIASGVLATASPSLDAVAGEAERLSAMHAERLGARSLDILHVASAVVMGAVEFETFDQRQAALARLAGLEVPAL